MNVMEASWVGLVEFAAELDPDPTFERLSDEEVVAEVRDGASRIAVLQCEWLTMLTELVVRGVWADQGARTPGQWLSWACGQASSTAREHVRVGLALRHLPLIRGRFAAGTLSYSKVRVLTRVAVPEIEAQLVAFADAAPASILARLLVQGRRSADLRTQWENGGPEDAAVTWDLERVRIDEHTVELRLRLPEDEAVAVEERIDRLVELADRARVRGSGQLAMADEAVSSAVDDDAADQWPSRGRRRAQAVCDGLATAVAAGPTDRSGSDDHLVVLHVGVDELADAAGDAAASHGDGAAASGGDAAGAADAGGGRSAGVRAHVSTGRGRGMWVSRSAVARLACDAQVRLAGVDGHGHPADIGRRSRTVPGDLRRALQLRDRHCRFPGCHRTRGVHAHHVRHWAAGGPTELANLVLLCAHHHRFVHDRGWTLRPVGGAPGRWSFHAPGDGAPTPGVWALPGAAAASLQAVRDTRPPEAALQPPWWDGAAYDVHETVGIIADLILDLAA